jgi:hypothetical protein
VSELGRPRVSVVMPAYNAEPFVAEAVASVLSQSFDELELIAVDDGSTDGTRRTLASFDDPRLIVVEHGHNRGLVDALNTGLEHARGELIAIQNADDVSLADRLAEQVALFDADPDLVVVGSAYELIDDTGASIGLKGNPLSDFEIRWKALFATPFGHPTVMFRTDVLRRNGLRYVHDLLHAEDYALWSALLEHGKGANVSRPLVRYRVHRGQSSAANWDLQNAVADQVALSNLKAQGVEVDPAAVPRLRSLYLAEPRPLSASEFRDARVLLEAAAALRRDPRIADRDLQPVVRGLLDKLWVGRRGLGLGGLAHFVRVAAAHDPLWLVVAPARLLARRSRRL